MTPYILIKLLLVSAVRARYLSARKATDPYIFCPGSLPALDAGWPSGYSPNNYDGNLLSLCSTVNGNQAANVGCICTTSSGQLHCDPNVADSNLYNAPALTTGQTFPEYCKSNCYCQSQTQSLQSIEFSHPDVSSPFTRAAAAAAMRNSGGSSAQSGSNSNDTGPNPFAGMSNLNNQCGNNCSTNSDCTGGAGCTCQAHSQQIIPGSGSGLGTVQYLSACIIMLGTSIPGKREEALPCPCNATYVSHRCCDSQDGMVWESHKKKLGELAGADNM